MASIKPINFKPKPNELGFENITKIDEGFELNEKERIRLINEFLKENKAVTDSASNLLHKQTELLIHDVYITLSVQEIYKKIIKENLFNWTKFTLLQIYSIITLMFTNLLFLFLITYFRPALITNRHLCFDQHSLNFVQCAFRDVCQCDYSYGCVSFCYNDDYSVCLEQFKVENINATALTTAGKMRFIKYSKAKYENKSFFQTVDKYYCNTPAYLLGLIGAFSLGSGIGYALSGALADVYGKKRIITIQLIGLVIISIPMCLLTHFPAYKNFPLLFALWCICLGITGLFLLPFHSCLFLYVLENHPENERLKTINVTNLIIEIISLMVYLFYEVYIMNTSYYFYFIIVYLIIYTIIFIFVMKETARFYSERHDDIEQKAQIIRFYMKPWTASHFIKDKKIIFDGYKRIALLRKAPSELKVDNSNCNDESIFNKETMPLVKTITKLQTLGMTQGDNSKSLTLSYKSIKKKYNDNRHIKKSFYLIFVCWLAITMCFYAIIFSFIRDTTNPNLPANVNEKIIVILYLAFFTFIIIPLINKIVLEMFSFEGMIPILFIMFTLFALLYDIPDFSQDSERIDYFGNYIERYDSSKNLYIHATSVWLITWIYHIYEFLVLRQTPTLYRTIFFFNLKALFQIGLFIVVISSFSLEYFSLLIGLIGLVTTLLLYSLKVSWKYEMFEELKDIENQKLNIN